jgi:hypothetical protein
MLGVRFALHSGNVFRKPLSYKHYCSRQTFLLLIKKGLLGEHHCSRFMLDLNSTPLFQKVGRLSFSQTFPTLLTSLKKIKVILTIKG